MAAASIHPRIAPGLGPVVTVVSGVVLVVVFSSIAMVTPFVTKVSPHFHDGSAMLGRLLYLLVPDCCRLCLSPTFDHAQSRR